MYPFWLVSKPRKIPCTPHSVCLREVVWIVLHFLARTGYPKILKWCMRGFSPIKSWYGIVTCPLSFCNLSTGKMLKILNAWARAWYMNVSGSQVCTRRELPIIEMVYQVHLVKWFWYSLLGTVTVVCQRSSSTVGTPVRRIEYQHLHTCILYSSIHS